MFDLSPIEPKVLDVSTADESSKKSKNIILVCVVWTIICWYELICML
jgi:hypothetical protein